MIEPISKSEARMRHYYKHKKLGLCADCSNKAEEESSNRVSKAIRRLR